MRAACQRLIIYAFFISRRSIRAGSDTDGQRVLPVSYSDYYLTLLPGERRKLEIRCPSAAAHCSQLQIRGWNVQPATVRIESGS